MSILKAGIKHSIKMFRENKEIDGFDFDLFNLIDDLYQYTLILEERIEKLEEKAKE